MAPPVQLSLTPDQFLDFDVVFKKLYPGVSNYVIRQKSIDARHRKVRVLVTVDLAPDKNPPSLPLPKLKKCSQQEPPVVIAGAGPAGLFAAYALASQGIPSLVIDKGRDFPSRHFAGRDLRLHGRLTGAPAMTCGLGGAGTYSDGKLHTRKKGPSTQLVLSLLAWLTSDQDMVVDSHPHVGSNRLPVAIQRLRTLLEAHGVRFMFETELTGIVSGRHKVTGILTSSNDVIDARAVVLAPGNSARRTFQLLLEQGLPLEPKPFAVGVRIEHPQCWVDSTQYGQWAGHPALGAARYAYTFQIGQRAVYSFCMCPGGYVIPTPPEPDHLAVNGMSHSTRNSGWSNAAMAVTVSERDWAAYGNGPLAGMALQRSIESRAWIETDRFLAPAQTVTGFLTRTSAPLPSTSYTPGVVSARLHDILPAWLTSALEAGLMMADQKMRGFISESAVLIAPETLTSSPVRIPRTAERCVPETSGLYVAGEGAGWAGGITSSAADGFETGLAVARGFVT